MAKLSKRGAALIAKWEGFFPRAYLDPVGVVTIGYGTINNAQLGIRVRMGDTITKAKAVEWMMLEIVDMEKQVAKLVKVPLTQYQWDCIMSFTYNCGVGNLKRSTLLKRLNAGEYDIVPAELMKWTKARRRSDNQYIQLRGLINRRADEGRMWRNEAISEVPPPEINVVPRADMRSEPEAVVVPTVSAPVKEIGFWGTIGAGFSAMFAMIPLPTGLPSEKHLIAYGALGGCVVIGYVIGRLHAYLRK